MKPLKLSLLALILCCVYINAAAQDTLLLKTGAELYVKIEKLDAVTVSYHKLNIDTALYILQKSEVFMIKFANGTKYIVEAASLLEASAPSALNEKKLAEEYNNYRYLYESRKVKGIALLSIGGTFLVTGLPLLITGSLKQRQANIDANIKYQQTGLTPAVDHLAVRMIVPGAVFTAVSIPLSIVGATYLGSMPRYKGMMNDSKALLSIGPNIQPIIPAGNIYGTQAGIAMLLTF